MCLSRGGCRQPFDESRHQREIVGWVARRNAQLERLDGDVDRVAEMFELTERLLGAPCKDAFDSRGGFVGQYVTEVHSTPTRKKGVLRVIGRFVIAL
jgi:hypothetical protein